MAHATRSVPTSLAMTFGALLLVAASLGCGGGSSAAQDAAVLVPPSDPGSQTGQPSVPTDSSTPTDSTQPPPPPQPAGPAVKVAFAAALPGADFAPLDQAPLSTSSVFAVADWTGVTADQAERIKFTSPGGAVYYATNVPFAEASDGLASSFLLADGTRRVVYELLVTGTTIESYAQVGTWTATVKLVDGDVSGNASIELE